MGRKAWLKASVGGEPNQPPTTGWKFYNRDTGYYNEDQSLKFENWDTDDWEDDPTLSCTIPSTSPPCCLTVSLSGAAKEAQGKCEGEYKSTGLVSMGRKVNIYVRQVGQEFFLAGFQIGGVR